MLKQEAALPPKQAAAFQKFFDLQYNLVHISENNYDELKNFILDQFTKSPDLVETVATEIVYAASTKFVNEELYARLVYNIINSIRVKPILSFFKPKFWSEFRSYSPDYPNFRFIQTCFKKHAFSIEEIVEQIELWPQSTSTNSIFDFFVYFAPAINQYNLTKFFELLTKIEGLRKFTRTQRVFYGDWDEIRENRWERLEMLFRDGCEKGTLKYDLRYDDIDHLRQLCSDKSFNVNQIMLPDLIEPPIMNHEPTLVQYAAYYGSVRCFRHLMHKGADSRAVDKENLNLLDFALIGGCRKIIDSVMKHARALKPTLSVLIKYHLDQEFNVFYQSSIFTENNLNNALHICIQLNNLSIFNALLSYGISINHIASGGFTTLMEAVMDNRLDILRLLLTFKEVDSTKLNEGGKSAIHLCCDTKNVNAAKLIFERCGADCLRLQTSMSKELPIHIACENGDINMVRFIAKNASDTFNTQNFQSMTPIMIASKCGHLNIIQALLAMDFVDVVARDKDGMTCLHHAVDAGHIEIVEELSWANKEIVNTQDNYGMTPLHIACEVGDVEMVDVFLELDYINADLTDKDGKLAKELTDDAEIQELFAKYGKRVAERI